MTSQSSVVKFLAETRRPERPFKEQIREGRKGRHGVTGVPSKSERSAPATIKLREWKDSAATFLLQYRARQTSACS